LQGRPGLREPAYSVELPGITDEQQAIQLFIQQTALLEFVDSAS